MPPPSDWLSWEFWAQDSQGLYHLALIVAGMIGIPLLAIRTFAANRSANAALKQAKVALKQAEIALEQIKGDREHRITESFAKAVEQLGSDKLETRLGGIYTLERIARESAREYWPIMETLTAFVRERAPWPPRSDRPPRLNSSPRRPGGVELPGPQIRPATDIQAILTVLGRRDEQARKQDKSARQSLDLTATDLRGALLWGAHLEGASLWGAHLEGAHLEEAHLKGAHLAKAHLKGAHLWRAHLEGAYLRGAHLEGAHLSKALGLTQEQLEKASGDARTVLPEGLTRPEQWPAALPDQHPPNPDNPR